MSLPPYSDDAAICGRLCDSSVRLHSSPSTNLPLLRQDRQDRVLVSMSGRLARQSD